MKCLVGICIHEAGMLLLSISCIVTVVVTVIINIVINVGLPDLFTPMVSP